MAHLLVVSGQLACFRRPEIVGDTVSYDVMTPVAARRLFEAVHWTPAIRWDVERIVVLHPIRTEWRREGNQNFLNLIDVGYALHARFELTDERRAGDNAAKHADMFRRKGRQQSFAQNPFLGRRGLTADLRMVDEGDVPRSAYRGSGAIDLGWMIHDRAPAGDGYRFFRAEMVDGIVECGSLPPERLAR